MSAPEPQPRSSERRAKLPALIAGRRGRHRVLKKLGQGGMAEVFLATSEAGGPPYCIKRMHAHASRADFAEEASVHLRLAHSLVVRAFELDEDTEHELPFLVLEYVDGISLKGLLQYLAATRRRLPVHVAVHIAREIAEALHYVHRFAIHRDISTSNVLVGRDGAVKLLDFGIAVRDGRPEGLTKTNHAKGVTAYMAPERFEKALDKSRVHVDLRSDLFSLGVCFYEMLSGERPFGDEGDGEGPILRAIVSGQYEPISTYAPALSEPFGRLVDELLAHDREKRPANALVALKRLEDLFATLPREDPPRLALSTIVEECLADSEPPRSEDDEELQRAAAVLPGLQALMNGVGFVPASPPPPEETGSRERELPARTGLQTPEPVARENDQSVRGAAPSASGDGPITVRPTSRTRWSKLHVLSGATLSVIGAVTLALALKSPPRMMSDAPKNAAASPSAHTQDPKNIRAPAEAPAPQTAAMPKPEEASPALPQANETLTAQPPMAPAMDMRAGAVGKKTSGETGLKPGTLVVLVRRWGYVFVDGKLVGEAPVAVQLASGRHMVEVSTSETDRTPPARKATVMVKPGQTTRRTFVLQEDTPFAPSHGP